MEIFDIVEFAAFAVLYGWDAFQNNPAFNKFMSEDREKLKVEHAMNQYKKSIKESLENNEEVKALDKFITQELGDEASDQLWDDLIKFHALKDLHNRWNE